MPGALGIALTLLGAFAARRAEPPTLFPRLPLLARRGHLRFRRYPLATVEVMRSRGSLFRAAGWLAVVAILVGGTLSLLMKDPIVAGSLAGTGMSVLWLATWLATIVYSSSVFIEERRSGRLPLILAAARSSGEILRSKVIGVVLRVLPWVIVLGVCALAIPTVVIFHLKDSMGVMYLAILGWSMVLYITYIAVVIYLGLWSGLVCTTPTRAVVRTLLIAGLYGVCLMGFGCLCYGLPVLPGNLLLVWALDRTLRANFNRLVDRF